MLARMFEDNLYSLPYFLETPDVFALGSENNDTYKGFMAVLQLWHRKIEKELIVYPIFVPIAHLTNKHFRSDYASWGLAIMLRVCKKRVPLNPLHLLRWLKTETMSSMLLEEIQHDSDWFMKVDRKAFCKRVREHSIYWNTMSDEVAYQRIDNTFSNILFMQHIAKQTFMTRGVPNGFDQ